MEPASPNNEVRTALGFRQLSFAGVAVAFLVAACSDDAIVYPNRNLRAAAGDTSEAGEAGEANGGAPSGGAPSGGAPSGGAPAGGKNGARAGGDSGGDAGSMGDLGGGAPTGPVCGDGKIEPPEQCDDGNAISGDGCSTDCQSSCEKCEKNVCPLWPGTEAEFVTPSAYNDCYQATGKITKGSAAGYSRAEVCRELVDCIHQESCGQGNGPTLDPRQCWCDRDWVVSKPPAGVLPPTLACVIDPDPNNPRDPNKFIPGKCASLFQDASEYPRLGDVLSKLTAMEVAEGKALRLLKGCDTRVCTEECVPAYFGHEGIATITADLDLTVNSAGESALGDVIADSQRHAAGADFAFAAGNVLADGPGLMFAATPDRDADAPGRVLWSEAVAVRWGLTGNFGLLSSGVTSENILYKVTLNGQQIYDALTQQFSQTTLLRVSGLTYTYDASLPAASRIVDVRKDGISIVKTSEYTVAISDYLYGQATGGLSSIPVFAKGTNPQVVPAVVLPTLLGEYLKQLPQPVSPPELNRITRLN